MIQSLLVVVDNYTRDNYTRDNYTRDAELVPIALRKGYPFDYFQ